ncbi:2-oxoacid:acceptor oxidoreductase subunit alpha, partial [Bacillus tropicus]|nr:2-oxoacid:acceptor oxidoreductase subunit alpha [Bacillus tropicus]
FKRYELTEDGVSPLVLPAMKNGVHHVTGVEHDETGKPSESALNRKNQMYTRFRKMDHLKFNTPFYKYVKHDDADELLV